MDPHSPLLNTALPPPVMIAVFPVKNPIKYPTFLVFIYFLIKLLICLNASIRGTQFCIALNSYHYSIIISALPEKNTHQYSYDSANNESCRNAVRILFCHPIPLNPRRCRLRMAHALIAEINMSPTTQIPHQIIDSIQ